MQQTELSDELKTVLDRSTHRAQIINYVLAVLLIIVLILAAYGAWRSGLQEKITAITLVPNSVRLISPTAVCPGDTIRIAYVLDITGVGVIIIDDSIKLGNHTVKFSQSKRDYIDHSERKIYQDFWKIPPQPEMAIDDRFVWVPGEYTRFISIAASNIYVSRYTDPASFAVKFSIKPNCP